MTKNIYHWAGSVEEFSHLIGNTYGELTLLEVVDSSNGDTVSKKGFFRCSCGKEILASLKNVIYKKRTSCGHLVGSKKDYSHLIGEKFGELTILEISDPIIEKCSYRRCTCLCSCGKKVTSRLFPVLKGHNKSCGHLKKEQHHERKMFKKNVDELIGKTFGDLTIVSVTEPLKEHNNHRKCTFRCPCGRESETFLYLVENEVTKSCPACRSGKRTKDYSYLFGEKVGELTIVSYPKDMDNWNAKNPSFLFRCSCGHEFEHLLNFGKTPDQKNCPSCNKSFYESNPKVSSFFEGPSIRNIHWDAKEENFVITIKRHGRWFKKRSNSLEEAIEKREELLKKAEEFVQSLN